MSTKIGLAFPFWIEGDGEVEVKVGAKYGYEADHEIRFLCGDPMAERPDKEPAHIYWFAWPVNAHWDRNPFGHFYHLRDAVAHKLGYVSQVDLPKNQEVVVIIIQEQHGVRRKVFQLANGNTAYVQESV